MTTSVAPLGLLLNVVRDGAIPAGCVASRVVLPVGPRRHFKRRPSQREATPPCRFLQRARRDVGRDRHRGHAGVHGRGYGSSCKLGFTEHTWSGVVLERRSWCPGTSAVVVAACRQPARKRLGRILSTPTAPLGRSPRADQVRQLHPCIHGLARSMPVAVTEALQAWGSVSTR